VLPLLLKAEAELLQSGLRSLQSHSTFLTNMLRLGMLWCDRLKAPSQRERSIHRFALETSSLCAEDRRRANVSTVLPPPTKPRGGSSCLSRSTTLPAGDTCRRCAASGCPRCGGLVARPWRKGGKDLGSFRHYGLRSAIKTIGQGMSSTLRQAGEARPSSAFDQLSCATNRTTRAQVRGSSASGAGARRSCATSQSWKPSTNVVQNPGSRMRLGALEGLRASPALSPGFGGRRDNIIS